jgi:peptidoglycan/LPS O-acetylase OafA/YrhL
MAEPREIRSLNTLRGLAALSVAAFHAPVLFGLKGLLPHAYLAVDVFFVISGFVMAHVYACRIEQGLTFQRFAQLRLARLYPLYAVAMLAGFCFLMLKISQGFGVFRPEMFSALGLNLAMLPAPMAERFHPDGGAFPFATPAWSIFWEIVMCGLFFVWSRRGGRGAWLIAAVAGVALAAVAGHFGSLDGGWTWNTFWIGGLRALFAFSAGVAVQHLVRQRLADDKPAPKALVLAARISGLAALAYVAAGARTDGLIELACVVLVAPLCVGVCALSRSAWLENRLGDLVGAASYSIYMLHPILVEVSMAALNRLPSLTPLQHRLFGVAWMVGTVAASYVCWRLFETPARRLISGLRVTPARPRTRRSPVQGVQTAP